MFLDVVNVLGLPLAACNHDFILNEIKKHISRKKSFLVTPLASQTFVLAYRNKKLRNILNSYDYLFSDSLWVKRAMNFLYNLNTKDRIRGSNLLLKVCSFAQKERYRIFLYGTTQRTLDALKKRLGKLYPNLKIVGFSPSKFADLTFQEKKDLIDTIEQLKTDILCLALGSPLEQVFSYNLLYGKPNFKKPIIVIPFGAAFDFISGVKPQAPKLMQDAGFEWLFRLICEPRRLWKRYLLYGPLFIFLVLFQKLKLLLNRSI